MNNNSSNINVAVEYYTAMGAKSLSGMERHLHPQVEFISPLSQLTGKEKVLEAAKGLLSLVQSLEIRARFGSGDQVMLVMDLKCPAPVGASRVAAFLTVKEGLITRIELFLDARPFVAKQEEIFAK